MKVLARNLGPARGIQRARPRNPAQERETGRSRGFGFVVMSHTTTAHDLLVMLFVDGRPWAALATPRCRGRARR